MQDLRPSLNLLTTSLLVSVSGTCRIHIALLLVGREWPLAVYLGGGLGVYATYTLDRALDAEEDAVNREGLEGSRREVGVAVSVVAFLLSGLLLVDSGLWWVVLLPSVIGYLYSKGVPVPGRGVVRLKGDLGVKNLVVGTTWATYVALFAAGAGAAPLLAIGLFFFGKSVVNSAVYDFRDVEGDVAAGIRTIPVALGTRLSRVLLLNVHLQAHLVAALAVVTGAVHSLPVVLWSTFLIGVAYIHLYGRVPDGAERLDGRGRQLLVNGEFVHAALLRRAAALL